MDVHNALVAELRRTLGPLLRPHYVVRLEERSYLDPEGLLFIGRPDLAVQARTRARGTTSRGEGPAQSSISVEVPIPDAVRETWLEVRTASGGEIVTVLEVLSPGNKRPGAGRTAYEEKRIKVLGTRTNLVEVDLLRGGAPMQVHGEVGPADYRILISRGDQRPKAELFPLSIRQSIPTFRLPLRGAAQEPEVSLRALLDVVYETGAYGESIDYREEPLPPLSGTDAEWADDLLRKASLR